MRIRNSELSNYIEPTQLRLLKSYSNRLNIKHGSAIYLPREFEGGTLADFLANAVKFISTNKDTIQTLQGLLETSQILWEMLQTTLVKLSTQSAM